MRPADTEAYERACAFIRDECAFVMAQVQHELCGTPAPPQPRECLSPVESAIREHIAECVAAILRDLGIEVV